MNPKVTSVKALDNHKLYLTFSDSTIKIFDVTPYLDKGIFRNLQSEEAFKSVRVFMGSVMWSGGQDLCADTLYIDAVVA